MRNCNMLIINKINNYAPVKLPGRDIANSCVLNDYDCALLILPRPQE